MTLAVALPVRNAMLDVLAGALDAGSGPGKIAVYSGTRPVDADTALAGNTKLVEWTLADPAAGAAASGEVDVDADPDLDATAAASGTATFFRATDSTGAVVMDGKVGVSSDATADLVLSSTVVTAGQSITLTGGALAVLAAA